MGLRIQLGHAPGERCVNPWPADTKFTILDLPEGIHVVGLDFCDCQHVQPRDIQLLRARLYPATQAAPETCAMFRCLETFQMLSFISKV